MPPISLMILVPTIAFLYSSVGFGGATGYLAAMSLFGIQPDVMASTALVLNILVAGISFSSFFRAGYLRRELLIPFIVTSVPAAFIGGYFKITDQTYAILLYAVLTFVAIRLLFFSNHRDAADEIHNRQHGAGGQMRSYPGNQRNTERATRNTPPPFWLASIVGIFIGLLSGMVGIGGGIFLSPVIIFASWGTSRQASAVAAAFIVLNSISGLAGRLIGGKFVFGEFGLWLIPFGLIGALAGSYLGAKKLSNLALRRALGVIMAFAVTNFWIKFL